MPKTGTLTETNKLSEMNVLLKAASKMVLTVECCGLMPRRLDTMRATVGFFDGRQIDDAEFAKMRPHDRDSNSRVGEQLFNRTWDPIG
jgi:hypothetical protein